MTEYTASDESIVNQTTANHQFQPVIAALPDGGYVVVWGTFEDGVAVKGQRFDANGQAVGAEFQVSYAYSNNLGSPSVAALSDGGFVVSWFSSISTSGFDNNIYLQRFDQAGGLVGGMVEVNAYTAQSQFFPQVIALDNGGYGVFWGSNSDTVNGYYDVRFQAYFGDGTPDGGEIIITEAAEIGVHQLSATHLSGDARMVSWMTYDYAQSTYAVRSRILSADGQLSPTIDLATEVGSSNMNMHAIALDGGGYSQVWTSSSSIIGYTTQLWIQNFDANGQAITTKTAIYLNDTNYVGFSKITRLNDGGFMVSWSQYDPNSGTNYDVKAQVFDTSGQAVGDIFTLNTTLSSDQYDQNIAVLNNGTIVGVWQSYGQDGSAGSIVQRLFTPTVSNHAPEGYATAALGPVQEDTVFNFTAAQLLEGFTDADGDILSIANLTASTGQLTDLGNGQYAFTPDADFFGSVSLSYQVVDDDGATVDATLSFEVADSLDTVCGTQHQDVLNGDAGKNLMLGFQGRDQLFGLAGDDILIGGLGVDEMAGGTGNDLYSVDHSHDKITEAQNEGTDWVLSRTSYSLSAHVENIALTGCGNDDATGNGLDNILIGQNGQNRLSGLGGNDILVGNEGQDNLNGGEGDDTYVFGRGFGQDTITDIGGLDRIVFTDGITAADIITQTVGRDLYIGLKDARNPNRKASQVGNSVRIIGGANGAVIESITYGQSPVPTDADAVISSLGLSQALLGFNNDCGDWDDCDRFERCHRGQNWHFGAGHRFGHCD